MIQAIPAHRALWLSILCMLALFTPRAFADAMIPSISVTGEGSVELAPDMAIVTLVVNREAVTARGALDANNKAMASVLAAMRDRGIADRPPTSLSSRAMRRFLAVPTVSVRRRVSSATRCATA